MIINLTFPQVSKLDLVRRSFISFEIIAALTHYGTLHVLSLCTKPDPSPHTVSPRAVLHFSHAYMALPHTGHCHTAQAQCVALGWYYYSPFDLFTGPTLLIHLVHHHSQNTNHIQLKRYHICCRCVARVVKLIIIMTNS